jgi:hypothetical protein
LKVAFDREEEIGEEESPEMKSEVELLEQSGC